MALAYNYSNNAVETTLAGSVSAAATSVNVAATTGFPTGTPYVLALGYGESDEELVKVTAAAGTSLTVQRGFGGTSAQSHSSGAKVRHVVNAVDLIDFRQHEDDSTGVHGLSGDVVGTTDTQSLSNKTLTSPAITGGGSLEGTFTGAPTLSGDATLSGAVSFTGDPSFTGSPSFTSSTEDWTTFTTPGVNDRALAVQVSGESDVRLWIAGDGSLYWENGENTNQVALGRLADDILATFDTFRVIRELADGDAISLRVLGDQQSRFLIEANGKVFWGPGGSSATDVVLERTGAGEMALSGRFSATVEQSSAFSAADGFSLNSVDLRKTCGVCTISVEVAVEQTIPTSSENSPNIVDTVMGTLPEGYHPHDNFEAIWSTGLESGSARVGSGGVITLRTSDYSTAIPAGTNLRVSATYVQ